MDNTIKILLTINLEGGTPVRRREPEQINYVIYEEPKEKVKSNNKQKPLKVLKRGTVPHYPLVLEPASQRIKLTEEAYNYMISKDCPYWSFPKIWNKLTETQRLESHLERMCQHFNGKSFTYEILDE